MTPKFRFYFSALCYFHEKKNACCPTLSWSFISFSIWTTRPSDWNLNHLCTSVTSEISEGTIWCDQKINVWVSWIRNLESDHFDFFYIKNDYILLAISYKRFKTHGIKNNNSVLNRELKLINANWITLLVWMLKDNLVIIPNFWYKIFIGWNVVVCPYNLALFRPATKEFYKKTFSDRRELKQRQWNFLPWKQLRYWLRTENK